MSWADDVVLPTIAAGDARGWLQVNLELAPAPSFRVSSWPVVDALDRWCDGRGGEEPTGWWLVRKRPGLRVRVRGPAVDRTALDELFAPFVAGGSLVRAWSTTYEPELDRLGGPAMIDAVHDWFVADTRAWVAHERARFAGRARVGGELMCGILLHELAAGACEEGAETWAIWQALCRAYAGHPAMATATAASHPHALALARDHACDEERAVLSAAGAAVQRFTETLAAAWQDGTLVGGPRALIATMASFHFNLWCVNVGAAAALCRTMASALHPASVHGWAHLDAQTADGLAEPRLDK